MREFRNLEFTVLASVILLLTGVSPCLAQEAIKPTVLASGLNYPWGLLSDSTNLYWADQAPGQGNGNMSIKRIELDGGSITTIASGVDCPYAFAADATNVYWVECHKSDLQKVNKGGGGVTTLFSGANITQGIATDGTYVYFAAYDKGRMVVEKVGVNGGAAITLGSGFQNPIVMAVDGTSVYFVANADGGAVINKLAKDGGDITTLVSGESFPQGTSIAVDSESLYWISNNGDSIKKVGKNGGAVTTLVASNADGYHGIIALDATRVFWVSSGLHITGKNGGDVTTLAKSLWCPGGLVIGSGSVYWTEGSCSGSNSNAGVIKKLQISTESAAPPVGPCSQAELGAAYQQGAADTIKNCRPQAGPGQAFDLTGLWQDDAGGRYRIRQVGDTISWFDDRSPAVMNVFVGTIIENTINGRWIDVPGGQMLGTGFLSLRIDSNDKLVKTGSSVAYGGTIITRIGGPPQIGGTGSSFSSGGGTASAATSGSAICEDPGAQARMDEWLTLANPPNNLMPGWDVHYDLWGRLVGRSPTATLTGLPQGVDTKLSRCEYLWSISAALNSTNIGTMKAYIEQKLR